MLSQRLNFKLDLTEINCYIQPVISTTLWWKLGGFQAAAVSYSFIWPVQSHFIFQSVQPEQGTFIHYPGTTRFYKLNENCFIYWVATARLLRGKQREGPLEIIFQVWMQDQKRQLLCSQFFKIDRTQQVWVSSSVQLALQWILTVGIKVETLSDMTKNGGAYLETKGWMSFTGMNRYQKPSWGFEILSNEIWI